MQVPPDQTAPETPHYSVLVTEIEDEDPPKSPDTKPLGGPGRSVSRLTRLVSLAAGSAVALLLLAGAIWWALGRPREDPAHAPGDNTPVSVLAGDAVALINSSTPIALRIPQSGGDSSLALDAPPESEGRSSALREAYRALEEGRHPSAISQFSALVGKGEAAQERAALWGLAEAYEASGQRDLAIRAYILYTRLDDPMAIRAVYRIALLHEAAGRDSEAAKLFGDYAARGGPARHAAMLRQARLLGPTSDGEKVYNSVLSDNPIDVDRREALAGLAELYSRRGDHNAARDTYDRLAALQKEASRPVLDQEGIVPAQVLAAEEARIAGDTAGARTRLLEYIGTGCIQEGPPCVYYPFGSHSAINGLLKVDANAVQSGTVSPMLAAQTAYDAGYYGRSVAYLDTVRAQSEDPVLRASAALLTGMAYQASGSADLAYNWYTATVQIYPQSPQAPEAIRRAGDMLVRLNQWDAAYAVYQDAIWRYPDVRVSGQAYLNAGILAHRLGKEEEALTLLRPLMSPPPIWRAEAAFWMGKVAKGLGKPEAEWKDTLRPALGAAPGTYLDFRARSLMAGEPDGGPLVPTFAESKLTAEALGVRYDEEAAERDVLLDWASTLLTSTVTSTNTLSPTTTPRSPSPTRSSVPSATSGQARSPQSSETDRAMLLLELGDDRAFTAIRALAEQLAQKEEWVELAQLVLYARYHADTRTALRVAERVTLHVPGDPLGYPRLLLKTLYPTPYGELLTTEAKGRDIDPLLMYALVRQESQFVPGARSHADARGLTQVIPSTGAGIAEQLGDTGYTVEDLYLPHVGLRYGTYYLANNMPQFDRKLIPTLAAYNGGPGNAARWLDGSALRDPDLYLERVDIFETEEYLRIVYTNYGFYRAIYLP